MRADSFSSEPWYNEFRVFLNIGVCQPLPEHRQAVRTALDRMGYSTIERTMEGKVYIVGGGMTE